MATLDRFVQAQAGTFAAALEELRSGQKRRHWMWYIFPQIAGLGLSPTSRLYAISGKEEARHYLQHELLGPRLLECTQAMLAHAGARTPLQVLGPVDALKFRSCMTLFEAVADDPAPFADALDQLCAGTRDQATLDRI